MNSKSLENPNQKTIKKEKGGTMVSFNHSKLLGKIRECGYSQKSLAKAVQMNASTLNQKLNNKSHFTADEMSKISELLGLVPSEIGLYFFIK